MMKETARCLQNLVRELEARIITFPFFTERLFNRCNCAAHNEKECVCFLWLPPIRSLKNTLLSRSRVNKKWFFFSLSQCFTYMTRKKKNTICILKAVIRRCLVWSICDVMWLVNNHSVNRKSEYAVEHAVAYMACIRHTCTTPSR